MEKVIGAIIGLLVVPIVLLNLFGGLVTGIILALGGDWTPLLAGLAFLFIGVLLISILMLPSLLFGALGIYFANRKSRLGVGLSVLIGQILIYAIMFGVSYSVFGFMLQFDEEANRLVLLVWSFAIAIAPWTYMASKEQDNQGTQLTLFASQAGLFVILILMGFAHVSLDQSFQIIASLTTIPVCLTTAYAVYLIHNSGEELLTNELGNGTDAFTQRELIAFVVSLLHVASSDGAMHPEEIKHIRVSFNEVTGERISKSFAERVYRAMDAGTIDVNGVLLDADSELSESMKVNIIMGAYRIAKADKHVHSEELASIKHLGSVLGLPNKQILDILKSKD